MFVDGIKKRNGLDASSHTQKKKPLQFYLSRVARNGSPNVAGSNLWRTTLRSQNFFLVGELGRDNK